MAVKTIDPSQIAIQATLTRQFAEGDGVAFMTSFLQDAPLEEINKVMDKINLAVARVEMHARVQGLARDIEGHLKQRAQAILGIKSLEDKYANKTPPVEVRTQITSGKETLGRIDIMVEEIGKEIERINAKLQG